MAPRINIAYTNICAQKNKKIILHIGVHKTGSKSIQHAGILNKSHLKKHNIAWVYKWEFLIPFHRLFYTYEDTQFLTFVKKNMKETFDDIVSSIEEETLLLSDEKFCFCNPFTERILNIRYQPKGTFIKERIEFIKMLQSLFKGYDVTVEIYLRRQDLFLESLYTEIIKTMDNISYSFDSFLSTYPTSLINWKSLIQEYETILKPKQINIRIFDKETLLNNNIIDDFYHNIGVSSLPNIPHSLSRNERIPSQSLELLRSFNAQTPFHRDTQIKRLSNAFKALEISTISNKKKYGFFDAKKRRDFLAQFEKSNNEIATHYLKSSTPLFKSSEIEPFDIIP